MTDKELQETKKRLLMGLQGEGDVIAVYSHIDRLNEFITFLLKDSDDICHRCKNHIECKGEDCDNYISGTGATGQDGEEYLDFKWTCEDFDLGTCNKLQNTPCNGCFDDDYKGFAWRGLEG